MVSSVTDQELVRRCLDGDTRAFDTLVNTHQRVLYNVAVRMVHDAEAARDIVQVSFVKAYSRLDTYDPNHKFFSWIYRIMMNEALNHLARRKQCESIDDHDELTAPPVDPCNERDADRRSQAIEAALLRLSFDHRCIVILRHFVTMSYAEIAQALEIPEQKVKSRLFEARLRLGVLLAPWSSVS